MSFTMLRGVEPLLGGDAEVRMIREQLEALGGAKVQDALTNKAAKLAKDFRLGLEGGQAR